MERLDRAAPSRRVAQIAAVIGREFSDDLLSAAARIDEEDMQSALSLLEQADIIYRVRISPFVRFAFKHVLLRDAIYDLCSRVNGSRSMPTSRQSWCMTFQSWLKISPKFWRFTIKKRATTKWPFVTGSSPGNARSRIPLTSKRLPIFGRPSSFSTPCRKHLSASNRDRHSVGTGDTAYRRSRIHRSGNPRSLFAGAHLVPPPGRHPRVFPSLVWAMGKPLDVWKER